MKPWKFVLFEATLHNEIGSWPGVACEITKGKYRYLFEGLRPQSQAGEAGESNRKDKPRKT